MHIRKHLNSLIVLFILNIITILNVNAQAITLKSSVINELANEPEFITFKDSKV